MLYNKLISILLAIWYIIWGFIQKTSNTIHRSIVEQQIKKELKNNNKSFNLVNAILYYDSDKSINITDYFNKNKDINIINLELINNIVNSLNNKIIINTEYIDFRIKLEYLLMNNLYISYWSLYSLVEFININDTNSAVRKDINNIKNINPMDYPPYTKDIIDKFLTTDKLAPYFINDVNKIEESLQGTISELKPFNYIKLYGNESPTLINIFTKIAGPLNDFGLLSKRSVNINWIFKEYPKLFQSLQNDNNSRIIEINHGLFFKDNSLISESININHDRSLIISPKILKLIQDRLVLQNKKIEFNFESYHKISKHDYKLI